jgi:uncharacterized OB-fold protein
MHVAQNWRLNSQRYSMKGVRCENCQKVSFPPREHCQHCREAAQKGHVNVGSVIESSVLDRVGR